MNAPKYLKKHKLYSDSDYDYLGGKGYTNKELTLRTKRVNLM